MLRDYLVESYLCYNRNMIDIFLLPVSNKKIQLVPSNEIVGLKREDVDMLPRPTCCVPTV